MNKISKKFEIEKLLIKEYDNWYLVLRKNQVTIGSLVLIEKNFEQSLSKISQQSFSELKMITSEIEFILKNSFSFDKINYLMLMMEDDEVHFHIIPRYSKSIIWKKKKYIDQNWPKPPNLFFKSEISEIDLTILKIFLEKKFLDFGKN